MRWRVGRKIRCTNTIVWKSERNYAPVSCRADLLLLLLLFLSFFSFFALNARSSRLPATRFEEKADTRYVTDQICRRYRIYATPNSVSRNSTNFQSFLFHSNIVPRCNWYIWYTSERQVLETMIQMVLLMVWYY